VLGNFRETISGEIDEIEPTIDLKEVNRLRCPGPGTDSRHRLASDQTVQQARLTNVAPAEKRDFRELSARKLFRANCTYYKLNRQLLL
jgi:hypothetical protein